MSEFENILNHGQQPSEDVLRRYLDGTASDEERYLVEQNMVDEAFLNDAVEGLQQFSNADIMQDYVNKINKELATKTRKKKRNKLKKAIEDQNWTLLSVLIIIILCIMGYYVIHLIYGHPVTKHP